jgi:hypothetical protein
MPYDVESDEAYDEMFESDEAVDESDEAARSWSRPQRPKVASGKNLYSPRPQSQYVTQAQLQTALAKVGSQVRTNSNAISQFGSRLTGATATLKKESVDRKKDINAVRSNLSQTQQMTAILPLLTQPQSIPDTDTGSALSGQNVLVAGNNNLSLLLPLLLLTSIGDGSSTSSGGGGLFGGSGGDNSTMLMLALVLGLGSKN